VKREERREKREERREKREMRIEWLVVGGER
jgi:hypothetical protein